MRPEDLKPPEYAALLFLLNPNNRAKDLAQFLGHRDQRRGYRIVQKLITKDYLDNDIRATERCKWMTRTFRPRAIF